MPWKGEKDPYKIWLSEIILQQTRVEQGRAYYERFIRQYPSIFHLAKAKEQELFKLWEGLGYYNRCKNLLHTACEIVKERKGVFPDQYEDLIDLKGVGPYTAAAIASFAYNLPYAVVDGNVFRVLSRYFGISLPIDSTEGKHFFAEKAKQVLDEKQPALYNQAIMDFGATVCKPFLPECGNCPLNKNCLAINLGKVNQLPVKEKRITRKNRWFTYFLFEFDGKTMVKKREDQDIWQNLYEFYLLETEGLIKWDKVLVETILTEQLGIKNPKITCFSRVFTQQLTHQQIRGQFIEISLHQLPAQFQRAFWKKPEQLQKLPFPKLITTYLDERRRLVKS
ncbi:MAG: A/G-specific adenine glycosylase [Bacteroidota bacterium]